jgi:hypothetical protein
MPSGARERKDAERAPVVDVLLEAFEKRDEELEHGDSVISNQ